MLLPQLLALLVSTGGSCNDQSCQAPGKPTSWGFIDDKQWVFAQEPGVSPAGSSSCPGGDMLRVTGRMAQAASTLFDSIEELQKRTCTKWITRQFPERCAEFSQTGWEALRAKLPRREMSYCIDPYEWPNRKGAAPWIMVTWNEAAALCESKGKRLCSEEEWTFACEGEDVLPYPNGYSRDKEACNIDRNWKHYEASQLYPRGTVTTGKELERLWQGHVSGSDSSCKSPFGVEDMVGNVDEWTVSSRGGNPSILKGGYWGPVRTRCRPSTRSHTPIHAFYQQGFRCCADPTQ